MIRKLNILLFLFISLSVNATSQLGDIIIWKGDTLNLFSNPLELRSDWKELSKFINSELNNEYKRLYPKKHDAEEEELINSTACWRGYVAEWKIICNQIYLSNIYTCHDKKVKVDLRKIFGEELSDNLLFADWISEKLYIPKGECIEYVHLDYKSIYEIELYIEFKDGKWVDSKTYNNYIARKSKFTIDPNPNSYMDFIYSQINWNQLPDLNNKHILVSLGIQPNKEGQIDSLLSEFTFMLDSSSIITDRNNLFLKEAIRIAELIPDWDVVYQRGQIVGRNMTIIFDEAKKNEYAK